MPTVAKINGIKIEFYHDEHPPPHFHAVYAEHEALIEIESLRMNKGWMPRAQYRKVATWAEPRREALRQAWNACQVGRDPGRIP